MDRFLSALAASLRDGTFARLTLGCWRGGGTDLQRVSARALEIRHEKFLSITSHYKTRDQTSNASIDGAPEAIRRMLTEGFRAARLFTSEGDIQLDWSSGRGFRFSRLPPSAAPTAQTGHDRNKRRLLPVSAPFLRDLGVTDGTSKVLPSMSHKWKQINKFLEILDHAVSESVLADKRDIALADFGAGKGYLTFAAHHHLQTTLHKNVTVTGIEKRDDLVAACNKIAKSTALAGISFVAGDIQSHAVEHLDLLVALHACDTATDEAIALGIRAGAAVIMCAPCCHKQIRPQIRSPDVLRPVLRFGIHAAQEAEMVTDSMRVLLMESRGYSAQVFEFISQEHTDKNKMILGVLLPEGKAPVRSSGQLAALKDFYGIREHRLEELLSGMADG